MEIALNMQLAEKEMILERKKEILAHSKGGNIDQETIFGEVGVETLGSEVGSINRKDKCQALVLEDKESRI